MTATVRAAAPPRVSWVGRLVLGAVVVALFVVGGTAFRVWQVARQDDRQTADAVVVLGAAQYDGQPSSIFAARLEARRGALRRQAGTPHRHHGRRPPRRRLHRGRSGRRYLIKLGVPPSAVVAVPVGTDTLGSLQAVAARASKDGWSRALIVSDPWHSLRARQMARDSGLMAWTSPTRSGPVVQTRETQARYIVRETAAVLYYRLTHASVDTDTSGLG